MIHRVSIIRTHAGYGPGVKVDKPIKQLFVLSQREMIKKRIAAIDQPSDSAAGHVTNNQIRLRGAFFAVSAVVLAIMWLIYIVEILTSPWV